MKGRKGASRRDNFTSIAALAWTIWNVTFEISTVVSFSLPVPLSETGGSNAATTITSKRSLRCDYMEFQKEHPASEHKTVAPVYITIGPPCGGKSEALKRQAQRDGYMLDDADEGGVVELQERADGAYQRVPLAAFLFPNSTTHLDTELGDETVLKSGITVRERLLHPSPPPLDETDLELRNVILRVAGRMTAEDFAERIRQQQRSMTSSESPSYVRQRRERMAEDLIQAVEAVSVQAVGEVLMQMQVAGTSRENSKTSSANQGIALPLLVEDEEDLPYDHANHDETMEKDTSSLPDNLTDQQSNITVKATVSAHLLSAKALIRTPIVDIFVPHALFGKGINTAEKVLGEMLRKDQKCERPASWCNTNTRPVEYVPALKAAQQAGRPVKFICWGSELMPKVPRRELLRRNVEKFRSTGRYVPAGAIGAALGRVEKLLREAKKKLTRRGVSCHDDVEEIFNDDHDDDCTALSIALAAMAGFSMDPDGFVVQIEEPNRFSNGKNTLHSKHS
jgi:hypothetical protein